MPLELAERTVVITGAGQGLGRAYALAAANAGANVIANDINPGALASLVEDIKTQSSTSAVIPVEGSVADWATAEKLCQVARTEFGSLDGLVNNAAALDVADAWDSREEAIRRLVEVNLLGTLFCGVNALKVMVDQGSGSIVNIVSGSIFGIDQLSTYGATKGGVLSATLTWASEVASTAIRVNAISPLARTSMTNAVSTAGDQSDVVGPDAIAPLAVFLLSDESRGVNGQIVRFTGRALALIRGPQVAVQAETRSSWGFDDIREVVNGELAASNTPVGMKASVPSSVRAPD